MATLDLTLLRSFAAIIDTGSFTRAGARLGLTQSAVSLHVRRLEDALSTSLLVRSARQINLTPEGETILAYARRIIALNDEAVSELMKGKLKGTVRLGTPEDFATVHLPDVLAAFARQFPDIALEVTCDLTLNLIERYRDGAFDMILIKREPYGAHGDSYGETIAVWRERLVWASGPAARDAFLSVPKAAHILLPLVVAPPPCVYRKRATQALDKAGIGWRAAYISPSLAGAQAAVRAGLGIVALPQQMVPADFVILDDAALPDLAETEIALMSRAPLARPAAMLKARIIEALERERSLNRDE
jgi:DNA-binding transcriptional LysR family regulator